MPAVTSGVFAGHAFQSAPGREAGRCASQTGEHADLECFNPRPAVRPGDAPRWTTKSARICCFNPRPAVRPGDAKLPKLEEWTIEVSIRARP